MTNESGGIRVADTDSSIPSELKQFFERGGRSLLIKGAAGTGKTTLALTLLRALNVTGKFLYISTRESPVQFLRDHAWIAERYGGQGRDDRKKESDADPNSDILNRFVDARLDEPTQLFERVTSRLLDESSPFIIIDTWDAMQDFVGEKELKTNARVLQKWAERAGAKLVFTTEDPDNATLDSLVEGVLVLKQRNLKSRRLREMILSKLYGVKIENPSYFFTLDNAEFRSLRHYHPEDIAIAPNLPTATFSPRASAAFGDYLQMGYPELDEALGGGLPAGSVQGIEVDSGVDMKIPFFLMGRIIVSFALSGNQVRLFPLKELDRDFVAEFLRVSVPRSYMKHVSQLESPEESMKEEIAPGSAVLSAVYSHSVGEESLRYFSNLARSTRGATIFVGKESKGKHIFGNISAIAESWMKISYTNGTLFLQSDTPFSKFFGIMVSQRSGIPEIELEPLV
jgi:KaiC/GvpD/RAD55 family RecA-like ATPase